MDGNILSSTTVIGRFVQQARLNPDRLSIRLVTASFSDNAITYGKLLEKSSQFANYFRSSGLREGQHVVIVLAHSEELIYAFLGAMLCGGVPSIFAPPSVKVPADVYRKTLGLLLDACRAHYLVTSQDLSETVDALNSVRPTLRILIAGAYSSHPSVLHGNSRENPDETAFLQYSSGTTGLKKGVALINVKVLNQIRHYAAALNLSPDDKIVSWLPLYHDMGLIACFILPLVSGVPVTLLSPFDWVADPGKLLHVIHQEQSTLCWMPNFAYDFMAGNVTDTNGLSLRSVRGFINCSEPIRNESHLKFYESFKDLELSPTSLWTCYAMAENTFAVTQGGFAEPVKIDEIDWDRFTIEHKAIPASDAAVRTRHMVSSGKPIAGNDVRILNEVGENQPERAVGEIAIKSDSLFSEYFHQPELTQSVFANGWFRTGDIGYLADGHLFVTGRKKDMMIIAGKNIYPQDLEEIVGAVGGIIPGRVVSFGLYNDEQGTEEVIVLAETSVGKEGHPQIKFAIAQAVRGQSECTAADIVLLPHRWLIKSTSGKISRSANREKYLNEFGAANANT